MFHVLVVSDAISVATRFFAATDVAARAAQAISSVFYHFLFETLHFCNGEDTVSLVVFTWNSLLPQTIYCAKLFCVMQILLQKIKIFVFAFELFITLDRST